MIYSKEDIRAIDQNALKQISEHELIKQVGHELGQWFINNISPEIKVLVLCGPGNNGNDGRALVNFLKKNEYTVDICEPLIDSCVELPEYQVIVDAMFGISINNNLPDDLIKLFKTIKTLSAIKIAIDLPAGVDPDDGKIWGEAFKADYTLTIGAAKRGLYLYPAVLYVGQVEVIEVVSLKPFVDQAPSKGELLNFDPVWMEQIYPKKGDHKYTRGKVSFVMDTNMPGACLLAASAAQACGAGYIQIFCPKELLALNQLTHMSFVFKPYHDDSDLLQQLKAEKLTSTYCLGPGWSGDTKLFSEFIQGAEQSFVLDGGFLDKNLIDQLTESKNIVITPHDGELSRLVEGESKWSKVTHLCEKFSGTILSKGYDTIIYQKNNKHRLTSKNCPFLSVAGTGDVLSGIVASFCAQGLSPFEATSFAVYLHSRLGGRLMWKLTPEKMVKKMGSTLNKLWKESVI